MADQEMNSPGTTGLQREEDLGDDPTTPVAFVSGVNESNASDSRPESPSPETPPSDSGAKPQAPMQKRRRVTRACDECRRKKIKCDGKQPCTHCTVYSYECTYDQPSNRRRNPAPQYIEALEQRLQKAESVLRTVLPGLDLDDPKFDARTVEQLIETSRPHTNANGGGVASTDAPKTEDDAQLQSMVDRTGTLDLDDYGNWDFHGHSSGYVYMRKFRAQFGDQFLSDSRHASKNRTISQILESPKSANSSPYDFNLTHHVDLPPREVAIELCQNTLDDCCALMRPIHRPTFFKRLNAVYDTDPEQYSNHHAQFLPLLYVVMAVGCLFSRTENDKTMLDIKGYKEAIEQGYQYFSAAKHMLDITDCRDLVTIQAIVFMILFLQSSAKLPICYAYIGIALRACCRLGLHRNLPNTKFNPIESEERKRIFWLVRKMDSYVGAVLGLPQMLSEDDIDQELPSDIDDDYITDVGFLPMPAGTFALMRASNAHTRLTGILRKVVRYIYPLKMPDHGKDDTRYSISHKRIRELERDLQNWMDQLPMELRPSENAGRELARVQQHLRMSYAHVQMMVYRPFIHYVSQACQARHVDKRSFACAAACISVARNIVHITSEMKRRGLLVGSYWFAMYTTYFAILSLVFFVIENPNNPTGNDILKDAVEGRDTLASLAKRSMAADRCSVSLTGLFDVLPEKLKERRSNPNANLTNARKRPPPQENERGPQQLQERHTVADISTPTSMRENSVTPNRSRPLPADYLAKLAKRNSMPDPIAMSNFADSVTAQMQQQQQLPSPALGYHSPATTSPLSGGFQFTPQMGNTQIPDLKNVMFPGDNPFAYPHHPPMSALESAEAGGPYSFPAEASSMASSEPSMFGTPRSASAQQHVGPLSIPMSQMGFDYSFQQALNASLSQQLAGSHDQDFNGAFTDVLMQNAIGGGMGQLGPLPNIVGSSAADNSTTDDFWSQLNNKGPGSTGGGGGGSGMNNPTTMRTGLTPGVQPPVLDEYFTGGTSDNWNPSWADPHYNNN